MHADTYLLVHCVYIYARYIVYLRTRSRVFDFVRVSDCVCVCVCVSKEWWVCVCVKSVVYKGRRGNISLWPGGVAPSKARRRRVAAE